MASEKGKWPFYISGTLLAALMVGSLYILNDKLGLGDALAQAGQCFNEQLHSGISEMPSMDWQFGFLFGILVGACSAALISGNFRIRLLADCGGGFTVRTFKTVFLGIFGGFLVMLGIQLSGDSVYGHIASAIQLSGSSWVYLLSMIVSASFLSMLLERRGGIIEEGEEKAGKEGK